MKFSACILSSHNFKTIFRFCQGLLEPCDSLIHRILCRAFQNCYFTSIRTSLDQIFATQYTGIIIIRSNICILIYGVDGSPDIKKELKKTENQIAGTVAQSPISMGKDAANTVLNILNGKDYEKEIKENVFMINQENVDMYGVDGWQ